MGPAVAPDLDFWALVWRLGELEKSDPQVLISFRGGKKSKRLERNERIVAVLPRG